MSIESLARPQGNHFNLIRIFAASAVIVSHSFPLSWGPSAIEPLQSFAPFSLGSGAVRAFFSISAFFIFLSFERRKSNLDFIIARAARILPGLLICCLFVAFVIGPMLTIATQYFLEPETWSYTPRAASLLPIAASLPGVFANNPFPLAINGSLWTLFFEVTCYLGLFVSGVLSLLKRLHWLCLAYIPAYLLCRYATGSPYFAALSLPFLMGMAVYRWRGLLNGWLVVAICMGALGSSFAGHPNEELWSAAMAFSALWLGFAKADFLLPYNRIGDMSYGTYIYGWPTQQVIAATVTGISPGAMILLALPIAWMLGALSWHFIEHPSLRLRHSQMVQRISALFHRDLRVLD